MNVKTQKFQSLYAPVRKSSARSNHRTTLPQSRIRSTAPSEREPGNVPIQPTARKPQRCGRFSSPLRSVPFNQPPGNRNVGGRFSSPLRRAFAIQPGGFHRPRSTVGADMGGKLGGGMKIFYNKNRRPSTDGGLFYNSSNFNEKCRMVW